MSTCKRYRLLFVALCASVVALSLAACGGGDDSSAGTTAGEETGGTSGTDASGAKVSASLVARAVPFFAHLGDGLETGAQNAGFDFSLVYAEFSPTDQLSTVENQIAQQPEGLLVAALDERSLAPILKSAMDEGVEVITVGDSLADPSASNAYVGADFAEVGKRKAEAIVAALDGQGKVAFANGPRGVSFVEGQRKGALEVFEGEPGIEVVAEDFAAEINKTEGLEATENILTANPDVGAIFYSGDEAALGGVQAIEEQGIALDDIFIAATDGLPNGVAGVQAGKIDFTISQCPTWMGEIAIEKMTEALAGQEIPKLISTPLVDLAPDTVDATLKSDEWAQCSGEAG